MKLFAPSPVSRAQLEEIAGDGAMFKRKRRQLVEEMGDPKTAKKILL
jgi:hypothetical protein